MPVSVKKRAFSEIEGDDRFPALAREYAAESAILGLPPAGEKFAIYPAIESSGIFHIYGAFIDGSLVGFIALLLPVIPHYGVAIAIAESFFVAKEHRKSGAGTQLRHAAERHARDAGSPALLLSAPTGGRLAKVLPHVGYRETNRVFMKVFAHDQSGDDNPVHDADSD